jgi:hypothetical protein
MDTSRAYRCSPWCIPSAGHLGRPLRRSNTSRSPPRRCSASCIGQLPWHRWHPVLADAWGSAWSSPSVGRKRRAPARRPPASRRGELDTKSACRQFSHKTIVFDAPSRPAPRRAIGGLSGVTTGLTNHNASSGRSGHCRQLALSPFCWGRYSPSVMGERTCLFLGPATVLGLQRHAPPARDEVNCTFWSR